MSSSLLQTKLYIPSTRSELVLRPRLIERMNEGLYQSFGLEQNPFVCKLTLIAAPAGFGKTTLVSDWLRQLDLSIAWLSLDEGDSELSRFLNYTIAALQKIDAGLGQTILPLLQLSEIPAPETLITLLINDIAAKTDKIILIFDDYHVIQSLEVHKALTLLLDRLPPILHLVILSRTDPPFPLSRLRVRQQITEIRDRDLRFTEGEAAAFLNELMGLHLLPEDVATLEARTEGWIAGLQLAALSLRGREDKREFVTNFAGSHRQVIDYLSEDVLQLQDEVVQRFLLQTSILDRLSGPLCDAVTGQTNSRMMLETLEQANLFIVPLDDERHWYRYHHLFVDFLQIQLHYRQANQISELHGRAAAWYEDNNLIIEAVEHALLAEDYRRAGVLIEQTAEITLWTQGQWTTLLKWLEALPNEAIYARPALSLSYAWALFTTGQWEAVDPILPAVEQAIEVVEQRAVRENMLGEVATIRACVTYEGGDMDRCLALIHQALDLLAEDNLMTRSPAKYVQGLAYFGRGNFSAARQAYRDAITYSRQADNLSIGLMATGSLMQLTLKQGQLQQAAALYRQARLLGEQQGGVVLGPTGVACVHMGEVLREWNDFETAERILAEGIELCKQQMSMPEIVLEGYISLARVRHAAGDGQGAVEALEQVEEHLAELRLRSGNVQMIISQTLANRVRLWLAQGNLTAAIYWADEQGLKTDDDLDQDHPDNYILLARVCLAQGRADEALRVLERLSDTLADGSPPRLIIEILVLQALVQHVLDDPTQATNTLAQALVLAEPEGYVRLFVDEGEPMRQLLQQVAARSVWPDYVSKLLAAFSVVAEDETQNASPPLVEPLSERELSILRLIAAGLSNREIADELYLSINTIKWYTSHIYGKLGVKKRAEAVDQAHDLGIL